MDDNIDSLTVKIILPNNKTIKITEKQIKIEQLKDKCKIENNLTEEEANNLCFWYKDDDGDKCYIDENEDIKSFAKEISSRKFLLVLFPDKDKNNVNNENNIGNNEIKENNVNNENNIENNEIKENNENHENNIEKNEIKENNENHEKNYENNNKINKNNKNNKNNENSKTNENNQKKEIKEKNRINVKNEDNEKKENNENNETLKREISELHKIQTDNVKKIEQLNKQLEKYKMLLEQNEINKSNDKEINIIQLMKNQESKINKRLNEMEENILLKVENKLKQLTSNNNQQQKHLISNSTIEDSNFHNENRINNSHLPNEKIEDEEARKKQYSVIDKYNELLKCVFFNEDGKINHAKFKQKNLKNLSIIIKEMEENYLNPLTYFEVYKKLCLDKEISLINNEKEKKEIALKIQKLVDEITEKSK